MKKNTFLSISCLIALTIGSIPKVGMDCVFAQTVESWEAKENLAHRLGAEWNKISMISSNIKSLEEIISEMRYMELYPSELTGINQNHLLSYDKQITQLENQCKVLNNKISLLKPPLIDALEIMKEMVTGEPVASMFTVLEKGDFKRINELLIIKHQVDTLWQRCDSIINNIMTISGNNFSENQNNQIFKNDFFRLIQSNLGKQSDGLYSKLDMFKFSMIEKATSQQIDDIYKIEKHGLKNLISQRNYPLAKQKILSMTKRYTSPLKLDDLNLTLAKVEFYSNNYKQVLNTLSSISSQNNNDELLIILKIQSLYSLKEYSVIWNEFRNFDINSLSGKNRNLFIWILVESGLALKIAHDYSQLAAAIQKDHPYAIHVLHALARTYLLSGDQKTALSIMESALKYKISDTNDKLAINEIRLSIATIYYELSEYEKALTLFYNILNEHKDFERALIGIVWCYIKLENDEKANTALKKLINQAPESPYAAESIFLLAKKSLLTANSEWKKSVYLQKEEERLRAKLNYIIEKQKKSHSKDESSKLSYAKDELTSLINRLKSESRLDYNSISKIYEKIDKICTLIFTHYNTGTFQDIQFTKHREQLLFYLDSTISDIQNGRLNESAEKLLSNANHKRVQIKNIVQNSKVFSTIAALDRYRWEREYLDWQKSNFKKTETNLDSIFTKYPDSIPKQTYINLKNQIKRQIDSLLIAEDKTIKHYTSILKSQIESLLNEDISDSDAAYLHYQYGELCYAEENLRYSVAYDRYEIDMNMYYKRLNDFRNGVILNSPVIPEPPLLDHSKSVHSFKKIILNYPQSQYLPSAHYSIAWCFNDMSLYDSAIVHMELLAQSYPGSIYAAQAWMYSGEYHFERGNLDHALKSYQSVLKYPESDWFEKALYKLAWSQYRLQNPEKAISSFLALVDLGNGTLSGATLLEKESMDYIAISFSEADVTGEKGLERALIFVDKLGDKERGSRILHRLASVYREQGRYQIAKKTYQKLLDLYPEYPKNATVETELVKLIEREPSSTDINKIRRSIFEKYNYKSKWAASQSLSVSKEADSIAQKQLYDAAIGYHQHALQKNDTSSYKNALFAYRDFVAYYPVSPLANECHYNLAEIQFAIGNYYEAAEEYMAVTKRYPDSKYRETAAWNAIVASQNLLKMEQYQKGDK